MVERLKIKQRISKKIPSNNPNICNGTKQQRMLTTCFEKYMFRLLQSPHPLTGNWHKKIIVVTNL